MLALASNSFMDKEERLDRRCSPALNAGNLLALASNSFMDKEARLDRRRSPASRCWQLAGVMPAISF
jgi:hypothetical protein